MSIDQAAATLRRGGVIAYPTEGVFGLGCLPANLAAVQRLLDIKQRDVAKGLILIASDTTQLDGWVALPDDLSLPRINPAKPVTWIVPAGAKADPVVRGDHSGIGVRLTSNPTAKAICEAVESPIVSTSANLSGEPVATDHVTLHHTFAGLVDYIVPGDCGPSSGPSEIRILTTGEVLRPH